MEIPQRAGTSHRLFLMTYAAEFRYRKSQHVLLSGVGVVTRGARHPPLSKRKSHRAGEVRHRTRRMLSTSRPLRMALKAQPRFRGSQVRAGRLFGKMTVGAGLLQRDGLTCHGNEDHQNPRDITRHRTSHRFHYSRTPAPNGGLYGPLSPPQEPARMGGLTVYTKREAMPTERCVPSAAWGGESPLRPPIQARWTLPLPVPPGRVQPHGLFGTTAPDSISSYASERPAY